MAQIKNQSSGAYNFGVNTEVNDVITEAFHRCGIDPSEVSQVDLISARRSLEFMFAGWSNQGVNLWAVDLLVYDIVPLQEQIVLPANTAFLLQVFSRVPQTADSLSQDLDLIMAPISRAEYAALPMKDQTSYRPTQFYFERTQPPSIYPWPVLGQTYSAKLMIYRVRMQQDVTNLTQSLDLPNRWYDAVAGGLAYRLAGKHRDKTDPDTIARLKSEADDAYAIAASGDRERVPLNITPNIMGTGWGGI
jgi:hypothetical protein